MPFFRTKIMSPHLLCAAAFALLSNNVLTQETSEETWYQVELILVERLIPSGISDESWPKDIVLAYPTNSRYLINPLKEIENDAAIENEGSSDELVDTVAEAAPVMEVDKPEIEAPFHLLSSDEAPLELASIAKKIERSNSLNLLAYHAWRQPVFSEDDAPAIVIQAGRQYDKHFELEGSVQISVSRYLHIDTNLWLTSFEANYGQPQGQWPELPTAPINVDELLSSDPALLNPEMESEHPTDLVTDLPSDSTLDTTLNNIENPSVHDNTSTTDMYATDTAAPITAIPKLEIGTSTDLTAPNGFNFTTSIDAHSPFNQEQELAQYVRTQIVTLKQKRRMRSGELHYIDHPKLGVIVKVVPYEREQAETIDN